MAKLNLNNNTGQKTSKNVASQKPLQSAASQDKGDRILVLIHSGMQEVNMLASIFNTMDSTLVTRKANEVDNSIKLSKAEIDAKKEEHRHSEEMAKIDREWKKISYAAEDRERRLSIIQEQIQKFQAEYEKYMAMETKDFLSDTVTSRLESLRKIIMELTKELNRV